MKENSLSDDDQNDSDNDMGMLENVLDDGEEDDSEDDFDNDMEKLINDGDVENQNDGG